MPCYGRKQQGRALETICADTCERVTQQMVRAYGTALNWWMTGRGGFDVGPGTHAEQHARISQHFRDALSDGIAQELDRQLGERTCLGFGAPSHVRAATEQTCQRAQALFLRGQYRVNLLFFWLFVELERSRERAGVEACLRGATAPLAQPPHDPEL